jgi:hypothetical protein
MDVGAELEGKVGPFPLYVWLLIATAAAGAYYLFTKKKSGTPTTGTPGTACTQSDGSAGTWDSTGTVCQASTVSTVNSGTNNMAQGGAWQSRVQSTTATATTTPASTATASTPAATASTTPPAATTPTTAASTGNPNSGNWAFPAPTGLKVTGASKTSTQIKISWNAVKGPGGQIPATYEVRIFRAGAQIREDAVPGTSYTESGLAKGTTGLVVNVWANGGPLAPPHATANT